MADKRINENPKNTDTVILQFKTPVDNCFLENPYKVDDVKIYFVSKDFTATNAQAFDKRIPDETLVEVAEAAEEASCADPGNEELESEAIKRRSEADASGTVSQFYFNNAEAVKVIGNSVRPAWLSTGSDEDNQLILIDEDEDGNTQFGHFEYHWQSNGQARPGDYFVCWKWTPHIAGDKCSDFFHFTLHGDTLQSTAIPTHSTDPEKYSTLLKNYTPTMYSQIICDNDKTPETIERLNNSVADGFTFIEDFTNQMIDLLDANATETALLPLLANQFNVKLKGNDVTRWRRQIKNSVPLYKKKGTKGGLEEAFDQAGMKLTKCTALWQIVSQSTYCESFFVEEDQTVFVLANTPIDPTVTDTDNFALSIRLDGTTEFLDLTSDFVTFGTNDEGDPIMTWVGDSLSVDPIILETDDIVKVLYKIAEPDSQSVEDYIRALDLMDQKDVSIVYPPKNWNVRVLEEDDPLFSVLIPSVHPYADPIVWGQIRTEFPFSENLYNMEEYNGSKRNSNDPCNIDKAFVDECSACRSSKYILDVEIDDLTDDRILEVTDIAEEYAPFHAVLHRINFTGAINEFIGPPIEDISILVYWSIEQTVLSANGAQTIFSRSMDDPHNPDVQVFRGDPSDGNRYLTENFEVAASASGEDAQNIDIVLYSPDQDFTLNEIDLDYSATAYPPHTSHNVVEILSPHTHSGVYFDALSDPGRNLIKFTGVSEPITTSEFTYNLSSVIYDNGGGATLVKDNLYMLSDENLDFSDVKTQWDVDNSPEYSGGAWQVSILAYSATAYDIQEILPDGSLLLVDHTPGSLPSSDTSSVSYDLLDDSAMTIDTSSTGEMEVKLRARVELVDATIEDIRKYVKPGNNMAYPTSGDPLLQYEVLGYVEGETKQFYVLSDSTLDAALAPSVGSVTISVLNRIIDGKAGSLNHRGHKLTTTVDYESSLAVMNGSNPPGTVLESNDFMENYLAEITTGSEVDYYSISGWDGTEITLIGPFNSWGTTASANVDIRLLRFVKVEDVDIPESPSYATQPGHVFDYIDRRGNEVITITEEAAATYVPMDMLAKELNASGRDQVVDVTGQHEDIQMSIEWATKENKND